MPIKAVAKVPGGKYDLPEEGNQPAVLVAIIDLGTHTQEYQGESWDARKIQLVWELTTQEKSATENMVIGREFTLSLAENSNLGKLVTALTGKIFVVGEEFDLATLLGQPCLVTITHKPNGRGNSFAKVAGVSALPKGKNGKPLIEVPPAKHKPVEWEIDGSDDTPKYTWLPFIFGEPVGDVIRRSQEWKAKLAKMKEPADDEGTVIPNQHEPIPF